MITQVEEIDKLLPPGPCADCGVVFEGRLLDDDLLCMNCESWAYGLSIIAEDDSEEIKEAWRVWDKACAEVSDVDRLEQEGIMLIPVADIKAMLDGLPIIEIDQAQGKLGEPVQGKNALGLGEALECLEIELRYNLRAHRVEIRRGQYTNWRAMNDPSIGRSPS